MRTALLFFILAAATICAAAPAKDGKNDSTVVYGGGTEGDGWAFGVSAPSGWKFDCCDLATKHHANLLVFPDGWDDSDPDRVMVLVVWKKEHASVDVDWDADMRDYTTRFPDVKTEAFDVEAKNMSCRSAVYVGSDHQRDYVVFCDPGAEWRYRFGWSMSVRGEPEDLAKIAARFRSTIGSTTPLSLAIKKSP